MDERVRNAGTRVRGTLNDFQKFILRGNVIDLAVGIVIGAAFTAVVNAMVKDILTPFIGLFGNYDFSKLIWHVGNANFLVGDLITNIISLLLDAIVVYFFVVKPVNAFMARHKPKTAEVPTTRDCPFCLSSIPLRATKCAFCTAQVPPVEQMANPNVRQAPVQRSVPDVNA